MKEIYTEVSKHVEMSYDAFIMAFNDYSIITEESFKASNFIKWLTCTE